MASDGVRDFIYLLKTLEKGEVIPMGLLWGRCPDCHEKLQAATGIDNLVDVVLGHVCKDVVHDAA